MKRSKSVSLCEEGEGEGKLKRKGIFCFIYINIYMKKNICKDMIEEFIIIENDVESEKRENKAEEKELEVEDEETPKTILEFIYSLLKFFIKNVKRIAKLI